MRAEQFRGDIEKIKQLYMIYSSLISEKPESHKQTELLRVDVKATRKLILSEIITAKNRIKKSMDVLL